LNQVNHGSDNITSASFRVAVPAHTPLRNICKKRNAGMYKFICNNYYFKLALDMISNEDKYRLLEIAKKYDVSKVYLFGSNLDPERESNDIDLAVEGISDSVFFKFYSELIFSLSKPVDLLDLKKKSLLTTMVKSEGVLLYG